MKYAITLSERQSRAILQRAIHAHSQSLIEPTSAPDRALLGFVSSGDDDALLIELTGRPRMQLDELIGQCCGVQLFVDERYLFNSRVVRGPTWHNSDQLALESPRAVQVVQRRRFWRAKLAPSSLVKLTWEQDERKENWIGALLNVSGEGLACKLSGMSGQVEIGRQTTVEFELPEAQREFRFQGVIRNHTLGVDGASIIGIEFEPAGDDAESQSMRRVLNDILYRTRPEPAAREQTS